MSFELSRRQAVAALAGGTILAAGGCATQLAQPAGGCNADRVLAEEAERLLAHLPETATYNGTPRALNGGPLARRLDDYSPAGERAKRAAIAAAHGRIAALDCGSPSDEALHAAVVEAILANASRSANIPYGAIRPFWFSGHEPYLVSQISGPHIDSPNVMMGQQSLRTPAAVEAWLVKLESFGTAFAGIVEKLRADEAAGCRPPRVLMEKTLPVIDAFLAGPATDHPLIVALREGTEEAVMDRTAREQAERRAIEALETIARPAYAALREQVAGMAARGREESGVWAQSDGEALYAANVRALGDTEQPPDEIHETGLAEVERITAEMDALLGAQGMTQGSVGERMLALTEDPRFLFEDSDAGREELLDYLRGLVEEAEASYGRILPPDMAPTQQLRIRRVPVATEDSAPGGYYDAPSLDGTRPGTYWINLRDMSAVARFALPTLSYHEGVPGHHTQTAIASGLGEAPLLIRIASFNAYQEGWALYSERFMAELGFYEDDPFGDLGRLQDELFRAVRLVVDTGMHARRWPRERAIEYMQQVTGNPVSTCTAEIERYMAWPGQALGYKLGQLRLLNLREEMRERLGGAFDVRRFNAIVLGQGAMPLGLVAERTEAAGA